MTAYTSASRRSTRCCAADRLPGVPAPRPDGGPGTAGGRGGLLPDVDPVGAGVLGGALALTALAAWWQRRRDGAVRGADDARGRTTTAVLEGLGVRPGEADLTVVQFSTAFCGPCRATRARLQQLRMTRPGLAHVDVEAPLLGRRRGAPRPAELTSLVGERVRPAGARDGRDG